VALSEQVENLLYIPGKPALHSTRPPKIPDPDETFLPIVRIMVVDPSAAVRGLLVVGGTSRERAPFHRAASPQRFSISVPATVRAAGFQAE
jgi:hypothetical protein